MTQKNYSLFATLMLCVSVWSQGIGVNETGAAPHPAAILDASSTTKGFLPPRMTTTQRNNIPTPLPEGLIIFNTSSGCLETWDGSQWFGSCAILASSYLGGSVFCNDVVTKVVPVLNPVTGKAWMDRNLGANRASTSSTDTKSYGSIFQWGRGADGHQCVHRYAGDGVTTSDTTWALSLSDHPSHGSFIVPSSSPHDWRSPQNDNLWQGINGVNNPCPSGYRLPTEAELNEERASWSSQNGAGAFASPLKLPMAGIRSFSSGSLTGVGGIAEYWSGTVSSTNSRSLHFGTTNAVMLTSSRTRGCSVRCIKE